MISSMLSYVSFDNIFIAALSPDRLIVAIGALLLVSLIGYITGPLSGNANPFLWQFFDRFLGTVARKSYKPDREASDLAFRGALFGCLFVILGTLLGLLSYALKTHFHNNHLIELLCLSLTLAGGAVWVSLGKLYKALGEGGKLESGSFYPVAVSTRTNLNSTDDFGITRVGIGFMPQVFDKGMIAPLFWYLLGGLPLAYFYAGLMAARWALAKDGFSKRFGDFVIRFESILGAVPHLISGLLLQLASLFTPTAHLTKTMSSFFTKSKKAPYAEGGLPLNITAWALNVSLGGPVEDLDRSVLRHDWYGPADATAKLEKAHLKRAIYMNVVAHILLAAILLAGLIAWRYLGRVQI